MLITYSYLDDRHRGAGKRGDEKVDDTGKMYSSFFKRFQIVKEMLPNAKYFAVTRGHGWMRTMNKLGIEWVKELGPSKATLNSFRKGELLWDEYKAIYVQEIEESEEAQQHLTRLANFILDGHDIVLLCNCKRGDNCHRHLLIRMIFDRIKDMKYGNGFSKIQNPYGGEILC